MTPLAAIMKSSISCRARFFSWSAQVHDRVVGEDGARLDRLEVERALLVAAAAQRLRDAVLDLQLLGHAGDRLRLLRKRRRPRGPTDTLSYASLALLRTAAR